MGSFNIKCIASNQIIAEHDKCRVMAIIQSHTYREAELTYGDATIAKYGSHQYSHGTSAFWKPMTAFLEAEYSDYGMFRLSQSEDNRTILAELFADLYRQSAITAVGQNTSHELAFDFKALIQSSAPKLHDGVSKLKWYSSLSPAHVDFEEVGVVWPVIEDAIFRHRLFCVDGPQVMSEVKMAAIHERAYQNLVSLAERHENLYGDSCERKAYASRQFEELSKKLEDADSDELQFFLMENARNIMVSELESSLRTAICSAFRKRYRQSQDDFLSGKLSLDEFLEHNKALLDSLYAVKGLDMLNIALTPLMTTGQDYDNEAGKWYAAFVAETEKQVSAERKARYEE